MTAPQPERWPRAAFDHGSRWWYVQWTADPACSSWMPDEATARRCAAAGEMEEALRRIVLGIWPKRVVLDTLPDGPGVLECERGEPGPWYGVENEDGEQRGWSRGDYQMSASEVGWAEPSARDLAEIARAALALARGEQTP